MRKTFFGVFCLFMITALALAGCSTDASSDQANTLNKVKDRGKLIVGANGQLPGFGYLAPDGSYEGFDVDFGKVIAAAVLGDAEAVEFRPLSAQERFTTISSGDIDVLVRNTTWTTLRDSELKTNFGPTTFYDGQGIMVPRNSGITKLTDLEGARIGVETGTTTELNLADTLRSLGVSYEAVVFDSADAVAAAYEAGNIDGWTTDKSGLVARNATMQDPSAHQILEETLSKEPLGPLVAHGDDQWFDIVTWSVFATIQAEEFGITSANVDDFLDSDNPEIRRFLGVDDAIGEALGLNNDFAYQIIKQVGNYGEIFEKNLGKGTIFNLDRGLNDLYTNGGLLFSPPFR